MSDAGDGEEEKVFVDYDAVDEETGFKKVEIDIWRHYEANVLQKPEDDRPDVDSWADEYAEEKRVDRKRVKYVATMGIYAGPRDEFNQRTGSGKAIYASGDVYEGDFFEGKKHGQGHYIFKSQGRSESDVLVHKAWKAKDAAETRESFVARLAAHLKVGTAIVEASLEYGDYPCFHGDYHLGVRTGQGLMKNKDGSVYKGDWLNNKRNGQGMMFFLNGDIYSGMWANGQKHGFGTYRFANGGEYRGEWNNGVFTEGQWIMADGNYFEGAFDKKNRPCDAEATMHFPPLNMSVQGVFKKGKWAPLNELRVCEERPADEEWVEA